MILIAGIPTETTMQFVIEAAEATGIPHIIFNQQEAHHYELSISCTDNRLSGVLNINGADYMLDEFDGVFLHIIDYHSLPERVAGSKQYAGAPAAEKSGHIHQYLLNWLNIAPGRILNRPKSGISNISKPYQSQWIAKCGFKVPPTCITNNPDAAMQFKKKSGNIIHKSISSARSIGKDAEDVNIQQLEQLQYLQLFQQKLSGVNIRVHMVGDQYFATDTSGSKAVELPDEIATNCYALSSALDLPLCAIDLFLTDDEDYYCFEVNPSPDYSFSQYGTGQDIAGAIVRWLAVGTAQ